jgi:hypothetical protein
MFSGGHNPGWRPERPIYEDGDEVNDVDVSAGRHVSTKALALTLCGVVLLLVLLVVIAK